MARTVLQDIHAEGAIDIHAMRSVKGGAATVAAVAKVATPAVAAKLTVAVVAAKPAVAAVAAKPAVAVVAAKPAVAAVAAKPAVAVVAAKPALAAVAATGATGSKTNHGALTNDPSAKNPNAHDHQTDGIHDDNNRIGNNGLGPKTKTNWTATLTLAEEKKKNLPIGQKVGSSGVFYEKVANFRSYAGGGVSVDVVKSMTITAGEDSKVRDVFTFTRKGGVKGYGVEVDTAVERNAGQRNLRTSTILNTQIGDSKNGSGSSQSSSYSESGTIWVDAHTGSELWLQGTKTDYASSSTWSNKTTDTGKTQWTGLDPLALDLDGDHHISMTGVGANKTETIHLSDSSSSSFRATRLEAISSSIRTSPIRSSPNSWIWLNEVEINNRVIDHADSSTSSYDSSSTIKRGQKGVVMDFNDDGKKDDAISFATGRDAYLAVDRDGDGVVTKGSELFGPRTNDGLSELAEFDSNNDGVINKKDTNFGKLKLVRVEKDRFVEDNWNYEGRSASWRSQQTGAVLDTKNFQLLDSGSTTTNFQFRFRGRNYNFQDTRQWQEGYVQKLWSLDQEGITEINLTTLAKARPTYDAKNGFSSVLSTQAESEMKQSVLNDAKNFTGSLSLTGATLEGRLDNGGASTPTAQIAQIYKDGQVGIAAGVGSLGDNDPNKNKVPSAHV